MRLTPDTHLHSKEHLLADDLSRAFGESKRFAAYLGIAKRYYESDLRALMRYVLEKKDLPREAYGKYFFGALRRLPPRTDLTLKRGPKKLKPAQKRAKTVKSPLNNSMELSDEKKSEKSKSRIKKHGPAFHHKRTA